MSKRRVPKEIVKKISNAGFNKVETLLIIPDQHSWDKNWNYPFSENTSECLMGCGDGECREFANIQEVNKDLTPTGHWLCHISECQMKDNK